MNENDRFETILLLLVYSFPSSPTTPNDDDVALRNIN